MNYQHPLTLNIKEGSSMPKLRALLLAIIMAVATGVILFACLGAYIGPFGPGRGPGECDGFAVSMNKHVVRRVTPNTSNFDMVPVPYAKVELISTQTEFGCPNAGSAGRMVFVADHEGAIKGRIGQSIEDKLKLTVTAEGCQPLVYDAADVRFMEQGDFILNCNSPPSIPPPSPVLPAECKTIEGEIDWRINVNGETFQGFVLVAQIEISSVKNTFTCANGYPLQTLWLATNIAGNALDKISGHAEDVVRVRITALECQPFEEEVPLAMLLASSQTYSIVCDLQQLTPRPTRPFPTLTPSPTP
jgi:hypothetical protein